MGTILDFIRRSASRRSDLTDTDLLERFVATRDPLAFEALLRRHGGLVLAVCRRVLDHTADAEDAFQATFLILVRRAANIRRGESLSWWLHGVAYRVAARARKRRQDRVPVAPRQEATTEDPGGELLREDLRRVLDEELNRLPESYRACVVLCYLEGLTGQEAAAQLGWPIGTLWGRLARARDLLRDRLQRRGVSPCLLLPAAWTGAQDVGPELMRAASAVADPTTVASGVLELAEGVVREMVLLKAVKAATILLAAGVGLLWGVGWISHTPTALPAPLPTAKTPAAEKEDLPPFDGKLHLRQAPVRKGGKVALYSRNRHGNYPLASYAFHLGLRNDALAVANHVNLLYGNRNREDAFTQKRLDAVPGAGGGRDGGVAGAAGINGENPTPSDEFQVNCHGGTENRIVDLGKVDYTKVDIPAELRAVPSGTSKEQNLVEVKAGHVYVIHVYGDVRGEKLDQYVKLKVLKHRDNDAVLFEWAPLPARKREKPGSGRADNSTAGTPAGPAPGSSPPAPPLPIAPRERGLDRDLGRRSLVERALPPSLRRSPPMVPTRTFPLVVLSAALSTAGLPAQTSKEADAAYSEGVKHVNARRYKEAIGPLERALSLATDDASKVKVYRALMPAYRTLSMPEKMTEACEFVLRHSEQLAERRLTASSLASFYFQRGLIDAQMKRYRELLEKDKGDFAAAAMLSEMARPARLDKATAEAYKKRYQEAERGVAGKLAAAQEELAGKDKAQEAWRWKEAAVLWVAAGDRPRALAAAGKAEAAGPEKRNLLDHFWHAGLGDVYADAGKYAEAAKHFEKAIETTTIKGYQDTCRKKLEEARKKLAGKP